MATRPKSRLKSQPASPCGNCRASAGSSLARALRIRTDSPSRSRTSVLKVNLVLPALQIVAAVGLSHAATCSAFARLIRALSFGLFIAVQRSFRRWVFIQKSGLFPKTRARISAVGAVTVRRLLQSSFTCFRGTPIAKASAPCVRAIGSMNSSVRISPTVTGLRLVIMTAVLSPVAVVVQVDPARLTAGAVPREDQAPLLVHAD